MYNTACLWAFKISPFILRSLRSPWPGGVLFSQGGHGNARAHYRQRWPQDRWFGHPIFSLWAHCVAIFPSPLIVWGDVAYIMACEWVSEPQLPKLLTCLPHHSNSHLGLQRAENPLVNVWKKPINSTHPRMFSRLLVLQHWIIVGVISFFLTHQCLCANMNLSELCTNVIDSWGHPRKCFQLFCLIRPLLRLWSCA